MRQNQEQNWFLLAMVVDCDNRWQQFYFCSSRNILQFGSILNQVPLLTSSKMKPPSFLTPNLKLISVGHNLGHITDDPV